MLDLNFWVDVTTIASLIFLARQVKQEIETDKRNAQEQQKAEQELLNDQIRLLCISWCSSREKELKIETLHSAGREESQGIRISNYSNSVFRNFKLTAWYEKEEDIRVTSGVGAFYIKRKNGDFEPTNDKMAATHRQGVNHNIYALKLEVETPYLRPGDYFVCAKQGVAVKDETKKERIVTSGYSSNPEFLEVEQLDKCGLVLSTLGAVDSDESRDGQPPVFRPRRFKFRASCLDIRGNKWVISNDDPEWRQL